MPEDRPIDGVDQTDLLLRHQRRREPLDRLAEDEEPGLREALDQAGFFLVTRRPLHHLQVRRYRRQLPSPCSPSSSLLRQALLNSAQSRLERRSPHRVAACDVVGPFSQPARLAFPLHLRMCHCRCRCAPRKSHL